MREVFLPMARRGATLPKSTIDQLLEYAWSFEPVPAHVGATATTTARATTSARAATGTLPPRTQVARPSAYAGGGSTAPRVPTAPRTPATAGAGATARTPVPAARTTAPVTRPAPTALPPREPGPVARWWSHAKGEIGSDLTTHGLAYLGVLLLFVGVFGLVAFSFGDVAEGMRPVTEVVIAVVPFLAAWMLLRRGAEIAGRALELAGGLLLPVMGITSFLDGVPFPPDLTGVPLVVAATTVAVATSVGYALWSRRHASSALRFLVAPMAWLAVGLAAMGIGREIPSGGGVASVTAAQAALITVAMAATLALARWRPAAQLSTASLTSARIGAPIVGVLVVLSWIAADFPVVPVLVAGLGGVAALALLRLGISALAEVLWWTTTVVALEFGSGADSRELVAAIALAGFVALLELSARAGRGLATGLAAAGAALAALATWVDPWWALGAMVALALWSGVRRLHPWTLAGSTDVLDLTAGVTPIAAVAALGIATAHAPLAVLVASLLVLASLAALDIPVVRDLVRRDESDHFWMLWWDAGMIATALAAAVMATAYWPDVVAAQWMLVAAFVVLALSASAGPVPRSWRAWPVLGLLTVAWLTAAAIVAWPTAVTAGVPAGVALALVVLAQLAPATVRPWSSPGSLGLAGHVLALVAVGVVLEATVGALTGGLLTGVVLAFAAGLVVTVATDEFARSPVIGLAGRTERGFFAASAQTLMTATLAACALLVVDATGLVPAGSTWTGVTLSVVALLYAAATWLRASTSLRTVLAWSAVAASLVALPISGARAPQLVSLVVVALLPLVLAAAARPRAAVWLGWSALAPAAAVGLQLAVPAYDALREPAALGVVLLGVGGVLAIGAMALDLRGRGWVTTWMPTAPGLRPPALVGAVEVVIGTILAASPLTASTPIFGRLTLAAAGVVLALALLARVWSATAAAALLVWLGVWQLASDSLTTMPWVGLLATTVLLAGAQVASRYAVGQSRWVRADVPLLVAAHVTALTSLVTAPSGRWPGMVLLVLGLLAAAVSWRLHRAPVAGTAYGLTSAVLVVFAGAFGGGGWLVLALAAVSVACSIVAMRVRAVARMLLVVAGMLTAIGAWLAFASWLDLSPQATVDWTSMLAAGVMLVCAVLLRRTTLDRFVLLARAGIALAALLLTPLVAANEPAGLADVLSWFTVASLLIAAVATGLAAASTHAALRFGAVALLLLALVEGLVLAALSSGWQLVVLAVLSLVAAVALVLPGRERWSAWVAPVAVLGGLTALLGVFVAALDLPDAWLFPAALLVASAYSAALSVAFRSLALQVVAALLACAAWVVWAWLALDGNAQWYTVPIGITLLVVVGLLRRDARRRGEAVDRSEIVLLESIGVLVLVGASFVQAFTDSLAYAVLAAGLGACVATWGVLTRVRRRLQLGAGIVIAAVAVLVLVPLAKLLPAWSSAMLWIVIACLGVAALLFATLLEQGRAVVRRGLDDLHHLTEGWE